MIRGFFMASWQKCHIVIAAWACALGMALQMPAEAAEIRIERSDCRWLLRHDGGDAEYEPGVDVHGDPVPPADLNAPSAVPDSESIPIRIRVDLQDRFDIPGDAELFDPQAEVGFVTVKDGTAYLNGKPLSDPDRAAVSDACRNKMQNR